MTLNELVDLLGGDVVVAALCRCSQSAVSNWRQRGVPPRRAIQLALLAERQGIEVCLHDLPRLTRVARRRNGR
jgi:Putative antitoxin of bacterial toxin-antitoxin system, YdaS/YdaT